MLNKAQWVSICLFSTLLSILISVVIFNNSLINTDDAFISIIYASIPIIVVFGIIWTAYLNGNNPIQIILILKMMIKLINKLIITSIISFSIGFGLKIIIELGSIIYSKYTFNENLSKAKYAKDKTWSRNWGVDNLKCSDFTIGRVDKRLFLKGKIHNKCEIPLQSICLRVLLFDKNNIDTVYDSILQIDSDYCPTSEKDVARFLPENFSEPYLKNAPLWKNLKGDNGSDYEISLGKINIKYEPYGGIISSEYIDNISRSNLKSVLEKHN